MQQNDHALLSWARRRGSNLFKVTVGQLVTLLELCGSESVAAMGGTSESQAVNYRQKLHRLEQALGVGPLTRLDKKNTRVTPAGARIAGEVRQLLQEVQAAEGGDHPETQTWILGAGDAWLQSAIVPALAELSREHPEWRWEVRNLKAYDTCRALREGSLHFGFVRTEDAARHAGIEPSRAFDVSVIAILAGNCPAAPSAPAALVQWLLKQERPLVQQGTTWGHTRDALERLLKRPRLLKDIEPQIRCETHTQAAVAASQSSSWCIVPAALAGLYASRNIRVCRIEGGREINQMALATYPRSLTKYPDGLRVRDELRKAVGRVLQG
jgi:DNA-binding transcriptional LysR family regulator